MNVGLVFAFEIREIGAGKKKTTTVKIKMDKLWG
jgi:hypothetical protein